MNDYLLFTSEGDIFFRGVNKDEKILRTSILLSGSKGRIV